MAEALDRLTAAVADRYRFERELGAGGMATVYLARDLKHGRDVALKVLRPELATTLGPDRFLREVQLTSTLQHPHILPLFDSGAVDGLLYYVTSFVRGGSLRRRLDTSGQLPLDEALAIAEAVGRALDYAHAQGVIHRDVKPENILLQDGVPLVADFGIALPMSETGGDRLTETGQFVGTPAYMSPEQLAAEGEIDGRSDQYSLACVIYEMLAGQPPFGSSSGRAVMVQHLIEPVPPVTGSRPELSSTLSDALARALSKAPTDRFTSAAELIQALRARGQADERREASIVVLPFLNHSPDPDTEYFADGLGGEITADLAQLRDLRVISRTSTMRR